MATTNSEGKPAQSDRKHWSHHPIAAQFFGSIFTFIFMGLLIGLLTLVYDVFGSMLKRTADLEEARRAYIVSQGDAFTRYYATTVQLAYEITSDAPVEERLESVKAYDQASIQSIAALFTIGTALDDGDAPVPSSPKTETGAVRATQTDLDEMMVSIRIRTQGRLIDILGALDLCVLNKAKGRKGRSSKLEIDYCDNGSLGLGPEGSHLFQLSKVFCDCSTAYVSLMLRINSDSHNPFADIADVQKAILRSFEPLLEDSCRVTKVELESGPYKDRLPDRQ